MRAQVAQRLANDVFFISHEQQQVTRFGGHALPDSFLSRRGQEAGVGESVEAKVETAPGLDRVQDGFVDEGVLGRPVGRMRSPVEV